MSNIVEGPRAKRAKWADLFKRTDIWGHYKPVPLADEALRDLATKIQEQDAIDVPPPLTAASWIAIVATPTAIVGVLVLIYRNCTIR